MCGREREVEEKGDRESTLRTPIKDLVHVLRTEGVGECEGGRKGVSERASGRERAR